MAKKNGKVAQVVEAVGGKSGIGIDFPQPNEVIDGKHYAVRISAPQCDAVEVTLDGQNWLPCRNEAGYWWFDLCDLPVGSARIIAKLTLDGTTLNCSREFRVVKEV